MAGGGKGPRITTTLTGETESTSPGSRKVALTIWVAYEPRPGQEYRRQAPSWTAGPARR